MIRASFRRKAPAPPGRPPAPATVGAEHLAPEAVARRWQFYDALGALHRRIEGLGDETDPLTGFELSVFSQNGEDGVIAEILRRTGVRRCFFVEIGAGAGTEGTCVALAELAGWDGICVEADPGEYAALEQRCRRRAGLTAVHAAVAPDDVAERLRNAGAPVDFDVLSIDTDGRDLWLWRALAAFAPTLVVVEYNAALNYAGPLTVPADHVAGWDGTTFFGASLAAYEQLAGTLGYRLVHTDLTGSNAFFVRADAAGTFPPRDRVPVHAPNYLLSGLGHRPHAPGLRFVEPPPTL